MSAARRPGGSWLKMYYDKLILVVALVILLGSSAILALKVSGFSRHVEVRITPSSLQAIEPVDTAPLEELVHRIDRPFVMDVRDARMLVGELRVASLPAGNPIAFDALTDPFTGDAQPPIVNLAERDDDGDGIPNVWEEEHDLDPLNASDALMDRDNDGFSNYEEYLSKTDPDDESDSPPHSAKLRLVRTWVNPFKLRLVGVSRLLDGDRFQLNLRSLERSYFVKLGEEVEGYTLVSSEPGSQDSPPSVVLRQGTKIIRLIEGKVVSQQARTALMVFLVDGSRFRALIGESIDLKGHSYKVIDINENRVVIRDETSGQDSEINRITAEEFQSMTRSPDERTGRSIPGDLSVPLEEPSPF